MRKEVQHHKKLLVPKLRSTYLWKEKHFWRPQTKSSVAHRTLQKSASSKSTAEAFSATAVRSSEVLPLSAGGLVGRVCSQACVDRCGVQGMQEECRSRRTSPYPRGRLICRRQPVATLTAGRRAADD